MADDFKALIAKVATGASLGAAPSQVVVRREMLRWARLGLGGQSASSRRSIAVLKALPVTS